MTNEERDIISQFIERVSGAKASSGFGATPGAAPALPPIDREADGLIGELFARYPEARYRLTQTAFVQEQALAQALNRIQRLEQEAQQLRQAAAQAAQAPQQPSGGGGFFSSLFGGGAARPAAPAYPPQQPGGPWNQGPQQPQYAPPQYAPQYNQGPPQQQFGQPSLLQRGGSGFLGSALTTAAGVAGGLVLGNALTGLFSNHGSSGEFMPGSPAESPWGAPPDALPLPPTPDPATPDQAPYVDQGSWSTPDLNVAQNDPGFTDPGNWDAGGGGDQASWDPGNSDDTF